MHVRLDFDDHLRTDRLFDLGPNCCHADPLISDEAKSGSQDCVEVHGSISAGVSNVSSPVSTITKNLSIGAVFHENQGFSTKY